CSCDRDPPLGCVLEKRYVRPPEGYGDGQSRTREDSVQCAKIAVRHAAPSTSARALAAATRPCRRRAAPSRRRADTVLRKVAHRAFVRPNVRVLAEQEAASQLDDYLHHLRERLGEQAPARSAREYLTEWADNARGWLRRYYPPDSDEPHYDLTPAAERAIHWLAGLEQRAFVGAESRLKVVFDLLRQIVEGSETDPEARIAELERRRSLLDAEIERIRAGSLELLEPTQVRERFMQAADTARALLADFRQVEHNFRELDRQVRERITSAEGGKGEVLEEIFSEHDAIASSDQGRSFHAF